MMSKCIWNCSTNLIVNHIDQVIVRSRECTPSGNSRLAESCVALKKKERKSNRTTHPFWLNFPNSSYNNHRNFMEMFSRVMDKIFIAISSIYPSGNVVGNINQVTPSRSESEDSASSVEFVYRSRAHRKIDANGSAESVYGSTDSQASEYISIIGSDNDLRNTESNSKMERIRKPGDVKQRSKLTRNDTIRFQHGRNFLQEQNLVGYSGNTVDSVDDINDVSSEMNSELSSEQHESAN